jgi:hypothetical protein
MAAAGLVCFSTPAHADVSYQYVTDQGGSVSGATGSQIVVNIYLQETVTGSSSSILAAEAGLSGAGVSLQRTSGDAGANIAANSTTFSGSQTQVGNPIATGGTNPSAKDTLIEGVALTAKSGAQGTVVGTGITQVLLGSITLTVGTTTSTFTLTARNAGNGNTTTWTNTVGLDTDNGTNGTNPGLYTFSGARDAPFTITVTPSLAAVPEPSSMLLCGFAACGMGFGAWRRYKAKKAADAVKLENEVPAV